MLFIFLIYINVSIDLIHRRAMLLSSLSPLFLFLVLSKFYFLYILSPMSGNHYFSGPSINFKYLFFLLIMQNHSENLENITNAQTVGSGE